MYLFFDTETTGLPLDWKAPITDHANWPRVVSIAWLLYDYDGNIVTEANHIIKPDGWVSTPRALETHGITQEIAEKLGVPIKHIMKAFSEDAERAGHFVAHNIQFDSKVVGCELLRLGMKNIISEKPLLCTMLSSTNFAKISNGKGGYKWPKLEELYPILFKKGFEGAHDAMNDIRATAECFFELQKLNIIEKHMPITKTKDGRVMFEADEETAAPQTYGKVLSNKEFTETYGDNISGNPTNREPESDEAVFMAEETADQKPLSLTINTAHVPEVKTRKRRTKAEMAMATSKQNDLPEDGASFESVNRVPVQMNNLENNPILSLVKNYNIPEEKKLAIANSMAQFFIQAIEWKATIDNLVITSVEDKGKMKVAKEARLALKNLRLDGEKMVKAQRAIIADMIAPMTQESELWLRAGQSLEATLKPMESALKEKEEFAERAAAAEKAELAQQRLNEIKPFLLHDNGADHYNLGDMREDEFIALLGTYKRLADERNELAAKEAAAKKEKEEAAQREIERLKKEKAELEQRQKTQNELIQNRLKQLPGVNWDGANATYNGKVVASLDSITGLSEVAFNIIAEAHQNIVANDEAESTNAKVIRRYDRLQSDMGFEYDEKDKCFTDGNDIYISLELVQSFTDQEFDNWCAAYNKKVAEEKRVAEEAKEAELKAEKDKLQEQKYNLREGLLLGLGLYFDGNKTAFMLNGSQMISVHSVKMMRDDEWEEKFPKMKDYVATRQAEVKAKIESEATDSDRATALLNRMNEFVTLLPTLEMQTPAGKKIVAGTNIMMKKIVKWVEEEKAKL